MLDNIQPNRKTTDCVILVVVKVIGQDLGHSL
jgi:hypothetical protein